MSCDLPKHPSTFILNHLIKNCMQSIYQIKFIEKYDGIIAYVPIKVIQFVSFNFVRITHSIYFHPKKKKKKLTLYINSNVNMY